VQTVIAEKLTGFQLTNKPLHCMQPELSLLYIVLQSKIKILRSLKPGETDFKNFKDCTPPEPDECIQYPELPACISICHFESKI
jgi:hypothetical protein